MSVLLPSPYGRCLHPSKSRWNSKNESFFTLPETNISAPKNGWLEDYFPIGEAYFQGHLLLVSGRVDFCSFSLLSVFNFSWETFSAIIGLRQEIEDSLPLVSLVFP